MKSPQSTENRAKPSRRQFLQLAALAGGVALVGGCASSPSSEMAASPATSNGPGGTYNPIKAIEKPDHSIVIPGGGKLAPGTALAFVLSSGNPGILFVTKDGKFKAISALCTHQGCTVKWQSDTQPLICPCHGSEFALDGKVEHGPATQPLPTYAARKQGDDAVISL
jgi:cytochrome b6-f complex iron-sulfur subunit